MCVIDRLSNTCPSRALRGRIVARTRAGVGQSLTTAVIQGVKLPALKQTMRVPRNFEIRLVRDNSIDDAMFDDAMLPKKFART